MQRAGKSALVTTKWLRELLRSRRPNHRVLDATWFPPNTRINAAKEFKEGHIPGAQFFDIDDCADKSMALTQMLPSPNVFENYVGNLGINNDTHVIVYDNNPQFPIFSAQRVWWTFRTFGHENISVLDGGLPKWISEGGPVTSELETFQKEHFKAKYYPNLVKSFSDVEDNIKSSEYLLVDTRPAGRYKGETAEPHPSITACLMALAAFECGKDDVAVYDGSWTVWYQRAPDDLKENVPSD